MNNPIELNDISAGYEDKRILTNVSIHIAHKDFVGIIGPNGGGKTTLLRVVLGMLKPFSVTSHSSMPTVHRLTILKWVISHSIPRLTGTSRFPSEKCYVPVKAGHS